MGKKKQESKPKYLFIEAKQIYCHRFTFEGKRYAVYGKTESECNVKKEEKKKALEDGLYLDNKKITFGKYYSKWFELKKDVKQSTLYDIEKCYNRLPKSFTDLKIVNIRNSDVRSLQNHLASNLSTTGVNHTMKVVNSVLKSAVYDRIINYNPCGSVKSLKRTERKVTETTHRALTIEEQKTFFKNAKSSYYFNLFGFLINAGCRCGEASALTWKDIDYKNNLIHINKTVSRTSNTTYEINKTPKTESSYRDIPLTSALKEILESQKEQNKDLSIVSIDNLVFPGTDGVFTNSNKIDSSIRHIIKMMNRAGENFEYFSVHAFRDTFATRCIEQGMQAQTLKVILGHSSLKMTMDLYAHVMDNTKADEMEKIKIPM